MRDQSHVFKYYGDARKDNIKGSEKKLHNLCTATATYNRHNFTLISNILDDYRLLIMVFTPHSESTPEQRQVAISNKRDKYNERKSNELREQLDIKDKEDAALHSLLRCGNKLVDRKEHRARTNTISSYHDWQVRHGPKALDVSELSHSECRTLVVRSKGHHYTHSFATQGQEPG